MSEFQELVKDAPQFVSMERGELVTYAYAMFAAGTKADSENAKLRDLAVRFYWYVRSTHQDKSYIKFQDGLVSTFENLFDELGIEIG